MNILNTIITNISYIQLSQYSSFYISVPLTVRHNIGYWWFTKDTPVTNASTSAMITTNNNIDLGYLLSIYLIALYK